MKTKEKVSPVEDKLERLKRYYSDEMAEARNRLEFVEKKLLWLDKRIANAKKK